MSAAKPNWVTTPSTDALIKAINDAIAAVRPCSRDNAMAGEGLLGVQMQLENALKLMPMHLLQMPGPGLVSVRQSADGGLSIDIADPPQSDPWPRVVDLKDGTERVEYGLGVTIRPKST